MIRNLLLLLIAGSLLAGSSYAQQPTTPTLNLADGWHYYETDEPCVAVLGDRCQVRNERGMWQVMFFTAENKELGRSATYRVDLPPTGILYGKITELVDADFVSFSHIHDVPQLCEYDAGYISPMLTMDHPIFKQIEGRIAEELTVESDGEIIMQYQTKEKGFITSGSGIGVSNLYERLLLSEDTGKPNSAYGGVFDHKCDTCFPDWWITPEQIAELTEPEH